MGGSASDRLRWKEPLHSLEVELEHEFGLSPVQSRALLRRLGEFLDTFVEGAPDARQPGQIIYPAVVVGERAGKPLRFCLTLPVSVTMLHPSDATVLHEQGSPALRRVRLARVCGEVHRQGAVLSHEDLSLLLGVDLSTVRRMVRAVAEESERPPTRGLVDDIGPTVSHKEQVLRLYFQGHLPARIAARTGHSLGSVERYLADFARVVELKLRGLTLEATVRITGMSAPLVRMARMVREAHEQAATLTVCQLAVMSGISISHASRQLNAWMAEHAQVLPLRGIVEDCSRAISHKALIVARHLQGESTSEIARATDHTPGSVERYVRRFEQIRELVGLLDPAPEPALIARILDCSEGLVRTYLELLPDEEQPPGAANKEAKKS